MSLAALYVFEIYVKGALNASLTLVGTTPKTAYIGPVTIRHINKIGQINPVTFTLFPLKRKAATGNTKIAAYGTLFLKRMTTRTQTHSNISRFLPLSSLIIISAIKVTHIANRAAKATSFVATVLYAAVAG